MLQVVLEQMRGKAIDLYVMYDVACIIRKHLQVCCSCIEHGSHLPHGAIKGMYNLLNLLLANRNITSTGRGSSFNSYLSCIRTWSQLSGWIIKFMWWISWEIINYGGRSWWVHFAVLALGCLMERSLSVYGHFWGDLGGWLKKCAHPTAQMSSHMLFCTTVTRPSRSWVGVIQMFHESGHTVCCL